MLPSDATRSGVAAVLLGSLVVLGAAGAILGPPLQQVADEGTVVGSPSLTLSAPDNRVGAGERVTLEVFVANGGDVDRGGPEQFERRVTTARSVRLAIRSAELPAPLAGRVEVLTGTVPAGTVPPGVSGPLAFEFAIDPDLPPGRYRIPVSVTYEFTNIVEYDAAAAPRYLDANRTIVETVELVVVERPRLSVSVAADQELGGGGGPVTLVVENDGTAAATDVGLTIRAGGGALFFGTDGDHEHEVWAYLEEIPPGSARTVNVTVGVTEPASDGEYFLEAALTYAGPGGIDRSAGPVRLGVVVNRSTEG